MNFALIVAIIFRVRDYLPLQQGLRLLKYTGKNNPVLLMSETIFHYNKD